MEIYNNIKFDSKTEVYFYVWLQECLEKKYITKFIYQPESIILTEKKYTFINNKPVEIIPKQVYTSDFLVWFKEKFFEDFPKIKTYKYGKLYSENGNPYYIEIKPSWDFKNMTRAFKTKQHWIYDKFNIYVNLINNLKQFFKRTFMPERLSWTKSGNISQVIKE
jgi:hypothetical protein